MSRVVVLGAGVAGHTAAAFARKWLTASDEVIVVSPKPDYNWIPSNIWVGVGLMPAERVRFPLAPVYARHGIDFKQARATEIHPEGGASTAAPYLVAESTRAGHEGEREDIRYDFLINATGPKLNFGATEGLGPDGHTLSVCTDSHAVETAKHLDAAVERMKRGERQRFLVGTGHGGCTCQGAAFEYIVNLEFELRARGVRDRADIWWISNEYELGDFGMGGLHLKRGGYITPSKIFTESLFAERNIRWITRAHVRKVEAGPRAVRDARRPAAGVRVRLRHAAAALRRRRLEGVRQGRRGHHGEGVPAQRLHEGRRRLHAAPVRAVDGEGLAEDLSIARLSQRVRGGHRLRPAPRDFPAAPDAGRRADRAGAAEDRHALGHDRQGRGAQRGRHGAR